jgi:hypothetical protein
LPEQIYVYVSNKFYKLPEKTFVRTEKICIHVEQIQQIAEIKNLYVPSKYVYVSNKFYKILKYKKIVCTQQIIWTNGTNYRCWKNICKGGNKYLKENNKYVKRINHEKH